MTEQIEGQDPKQILQQGKQIQDDAGQASTHFGFQEVLKQHKATKVAEVFHSVARSYDMMNDLMSLGLHRVWKRAAIHAASVRPGMKVLDIAGGTGDLSRAFCERLQGRGEVWLTDINESMLSVGRDRLLDQGLFPQLALCDAEQLPFSSNYFDVVTVAFGLRNMTNKDRALAEMCRVVKPGGKVLVLEFSKINSALALAYDAYSFKVLPRLGQLIAKDRASYQYLAESIRMHPDQEALKTIMMQSGFDEVKYENFSAGVVALHRGVKFSMH